MYPQKKASKPSETAATSLLEIEAASVLQDSPSGNLFEIEADSYVYESHRVLDEILDTMKALDPELSDFSTVAISVSLLQR